MSTKTRLFGVVSLVWAGLVAPASPDTGHEWVSWQAERCEEAALFAPTDYVNVAPLVPPPFDDDVLRTGVPGHEKAMLIFTLNRCTDTVVVSDHGTDEAAEATEVLAGVVLSGCEYSDEQVQFYTLVSYIDWEALATRFNSIGLPAVHVPRLRLEVVVDALTRTGTMTADIPAPGEHLTAAGSVVAAEPPQVDARAAQLALGPRGVVRVDHHSPLFGVNPGATAEITTDRADGRIGLAMGRASGNATGFFLEKGPGHHHTGTLLG